MSGASFVSKESYRVSCVEDILNIPDMVTAREYLKSWGLPTKGIREKDEAVQKLVDYWREKEKKEKVVRKEVTNGLQEAIRDDQKKRNKLCVKVDEVLEYINRLPRQQQDDLNRFIPDVVHKCEVRKHELMSPECTILVAGETGAGKSSFINLLLETNILPTSQLSCTSTFCELHKSRDNRKTATLYYKVFEANGKERSPRTIDISSSGGLKEFANAVTEIDDYMEESPYEKIVVKYPFALLEEGIVIVDTPGLGESKSLIKHVSRYLEKSFGFIYVVNSSNAGGIHEGRLKDFLRTVVNMSDEDVHHDSSMFVCNKWETVPDKYKEEVRIDTMRKLQKFFRGITEDQLFFLSVDELQRSLVTADKMTPEHHAMLCGIQKLLPASLENKLNIHYRFLSQILKRSIYSLKVANNMAKCSIKEKEKLMTNIKTQMQKIQCNAMRCVDDLRRGMEFEVNSLSDTITSLIRSPEFKRDASAWDPRECPGSTDTKKLIRDASELLENRIAMHIDFWERNHKVIKTLKEKIISKFRRDCELMEDQMREIEGTLVAGEKSIISDLHKTMKGNQKAKKIKNKKKDEKGGDVKIKTLGGAVSLSGRFDNSKEVKAHFKTFKKKSPDVAMAEATEMYIQTILKSGELRKNIQIFLTRYTNGIDMVAKKIPDFISSDQEMLSQIEEQLRVSQQGLQEVPDLIRRSVNLLGNLDVLFICDIMRKDYRLRDLEWNDRSKLGSGAFADVFLAKLRQGDKKIEVALKVFKDPVRANTASDILLEDRTMRDMDHRNMIRYYGCTLQMLERKNSLHWIMILEYCQCTLKDRVINNDYENPGKVDEALQIRPQKEMARFSSQICHGLEYLHSKDLVHRDLKLENILLTSDNTVKLTDVGLTKPQQQISGTMAGSPVYMAPEIHLQKGIYDRKADIFSIGIMLWEMWYGIDAADHISEVLNNRGKSARDLGPLLEQGLRPKMTFRFNPPKEWTDVIQQCWHLEPRKRPEARHVKVFFEDFLRMNR